MQGGKLRTTLHRCFYLCAMLLLLTSSRTGYAQAVHDYGAWFSLNTQGGLDLCCQEESRWKWWFDGHLRFFEDAGGYGQSIVRPGVGWRLSEKATLWAGYGWINESPGSGIPNIDENRIWQQLTWSETFCNVKLSSRSRLEQRFLETGADTGWRFRQFVRLSRPFECQPRLTTEVWDEAFFDLNSTDWGQNGSFSQNRIFAGLGWKLNTEYSSRIEIGYFNQFLRRRSAIDRYTHITAVNYFCSF